VSAAGSGAAQLQTIYTSLTASCAYCCTLCTVCLQVLAKSQQLVEVLRGCNIWTLE
jgi:hypothetical protein